MVIGASEEDTAVIFVHELEDDETACLLGPPAGRSPFPPRTANRIRLLSGDDG
jgi:hypothetical protein